MNIEICDKCNGTGQYSDRDNAVMNIALKRNIQIESDECDRCFGSGRIITRTYTYKVPFSFDKNLIYEIDSKIITLIRDLERKKYDKKYDMNDAKYMFDKI